MNKSIRVLVMIIAVLLMTGCEIGEGKLMKTKTGHLMYKGWVEDVHMLFMNIVEPTFNLYAWTQASEEQKPEILRHFYSNTEINVLSDHSWDIKMPGRVMLRVNMENGIAFSEPGGKMSMLYIRDNASDNPLDRIRFFLENKGNGVWEIYSADRSIYFKFTLGTADIPESLAETTMSLEGRGTFMHTTFIYHCSGDVCQDEIYFTSLSYDIQQPFEGEWVQGNYWYDFTPRNIQLALQSGKVALQALDENGSGNNATITVLNAEEIEIEMDGIVQRRKV